MKQSRSIIDVILPLAIRDVYSYAIPMDMICPQAGTRVLVPLGSKTLTGIVLRVNSEGVHEDIRLRDVIAVLDEQPIVTPTQLQFWQWMASYYMCTLGEVLTAALPAGIIDDDYKARKVTYVRLHANVDVEEVRHILQRAPKQLAVWNTYIRLAAENSKIERRLLIEESGENIAIVRALVEKNILDEIEQNQDRVPPYTGPIETAHSLSKAQQIVAGQIQSTWQSKNVCLLYGVTSSGKTEVYIYLIQQALRQGKQVLYLVPEIALTAQLTDRLRLVFGNQLVVYHSRFSNAERVEIYRSLIDNHEPCVVVGARSAIFLPLLHLGLVVVDEEHEGSYKQADPAPRYHARSAAIMYATFVGAKVLLGSATPSIDSYYNVQLGKYGLVSLLERYSGVQLPKITLVDLKRQYHRKEMYGHFSDPLMERMRIELARNKQIILFQNRRGYAPQLHCLSCGRPPRCVNCDVPLTWHKQARRLICHYCGYSTPIIDVCPSCGGTLQALGFGTERLEDEVATYFPEAKIMRMDLDTTRSKTAYQDIINAFSRHEVDILIGTQMVAKGLHFDNVSLVAVLNADMLLNQPDFRSYERTYQMLEQVSGRAGRKGQQGEVYIQTFEPDNPIYDDVVNHNYLSMFETQLAEREMFHYPPFYRLILFTLRHRNLERLEWAAIDLHRRLMLIFGQRVSAVIVPSISRVQNQYIRELRLSIESAANIEYAKSLIAAQIAEVLSAPQGRGTTILPDVDPL